MISKIYLKFIKKLLKGWLANRIWNRESVRNGNELLLTWVKWSLILLKNRELGEKEGGKFGGTEEIR